MLKVFPIQTKEEQAALCARCAVTFDADLMAYQATVDDKFAGVCQFIVRPEGGIVYDLAHPTGEAPDAEALFVMGRAALNFIDLCDIHAAYYDGDVTVPGLSLLHAIGFAERESDGRLFMDLTGFFTSPCKHCGDKK